jgi:hypothetical protein
LASHRDIREPQTTTVTTATTTMASSFRPMRALAPRALAPRALLLLRRLSTAPRPPPSGPTTGTLQFYLPPPDGSTPWYYPAPVPGPPGSRKFNYIADPHPVALADVRGREADFSLDTHGFLPLPAAGTATTSPPPPLAPDVDFSHDHDITQRYYPHVEALVLAALPGAARVVVFDHTIRRGTDPAHPRRPVPRIHVDASPASAADRVKRRMFALGGDAIAALLARARWQLVNVWRPINGTVRAWPLCFADASSVPAPALAVTEHRYPHRTGEVLLMRHVPAARWFYWSAMTDRDRILLLQHDSRPGAAPCPHGAFQHPAELPADKQRDSIEVGVLVFYDA